ncbi:GyrI-like domain-containing protein [Clostridium gasigenes]|uniref:GyrI-like domain-containing protein n=1 Tax=Clostridium gasigenes TaxID=94869 RepID=UPI001C0D6AAD|nr:GyrI-like domain-containing protein [Clostridium gasigenes]MBU3133721.1 GyrI-like domain-containing protein [Clostridium gasigenes]
MQVYTVPANKWAVFTARGSLNGKEHQINALWTRITTECFPTCGYKRVADYDLEVYGTGHTNSDDYTREIWIPITKK